MPPASSPVPRRANSGVFLAAALLVAAALAAWRNSSAGPFVLDDLPAIAENPTIRGFASAFAPPGDGQTVSGRPLVNLSFALNWAVGGESVRGYHALNLAIHALAALALYGVARRTLRCAPLSRHFACDSARACNDADRLAFVVSGLWLLHPLQTESVTYIAQRAESLAGLCLLFTLYTAIRGADCLPSSDSSQRRAALRWNSTAVIACGLGMAAKEVMYAAPLLVLLHDRTFLAGSVCAALRRRPWFYTGLASTWLLLGWLVWRTGNRGATVGFGLGISPWHYLLTQCAAIAHYLRLALWPTPLVLDYGFSVVSAPAAVFGRGLFLLALLAATAFALVRRPAWGFLGGCFFLVLAPSSSVLPVTTQTIAEHRMYLPLAAVGAAVGAGAWWLLGPRCLAAFVAVALALGTLTYQRNTDYRSAIAIWSDTAAKRPSNARAQAEFALALFRAGRTRESLPVFERALALLPNNPKARHNYANALEAAGRLDDAATQFQLAIAEWPALADAYYCLGNVRREQGQIDGALACYENAVRLRPDFAAAHNNAANLYASVGRIDGALAHFAAAVHAQPDFAEAHYNWANVLARAGRLTEAVPHFEAALRLAPNHAAAHENLGLTLLMLDRLPEAVRELEAAQRLAPQRASVRDNLATARARLGR